MADTNSSFASLSSILSRRDFIRFVVVSGLIGFTCEPVFAVIGKVESEERSLSLYNPRSKESFNGIYWRNGEYITDALERINQLMRDVKTNEIKQIDKNLLDLISAISIKLKSEKPFHVVCGYRSPRTNAQLIKSAKGAAKNSYHLTGQAIDMHIPGLSTSALRKSAVELKMGGVGYYPHRRFVHIDVGPVRYWSG